MPLCLLKPNTCFWENLANYFNTVGNLLKSAILAKMKFWFLLAIFFSVDEWIHSTGFSSQQCTSQYTGKPTVALFMFHFMICQSRILKQIVYASKPLHGLKLILFLFGGHTYSHFKL